MKRKMLRCHSYPCAGYWRVFPAVHEGLSPQPTAPATNGPAGQANPAVRHGGARGHCYQHHPPSHSLPSRPP